MGSRTIDSHANDIQAPNYIIQQRMALRAAADPDIAVDIAVQHPSGAFANPFLGGIDNVYANLTNVVFRIAQRHPPPHGGAILVNAHFDSSLGSLGAGDDAAQARAPARRAPRPATRVEA
jgi:hypothetical protein